MKLKSATFALCSIFAFPLSSLAGTQDQNQIIITASLLPQPLNNTIADTSVISQQQIKDSGAPDVATLLRSVAGIEIAQSGGLGSQSSIFMRGTNSDQVLVLIDGVRVNSATTGSTAVEHIMLDNIDHIEIVRGNLSSMYGSEAIGGVIQIFTRQGHGTPSFNASAGVGSHNTQRESAGFSGSLDNNYFSLNAGHVSTDGISAMNPLLLPGANPNNNGYDNNTIDAQIKHAFNTDHSVSASVLSTHSNSSFDNNFNANPSDTNNTIENLDTYSLEMDDQFNTEWQSQIKLAQGIDDSHNFLDGVPDIVNGFHFETQNNQLSWKNNLKLTDNQMVTMLIEHLSQTVSSDTLYTQTNRQVTSVLGGYTGEFGHQQIQLNVRQDVYSDFGTANTGLLGYGLTLSKNWRITANISNAFTAPSFNYLYYPGYANPNLQPELSENKDIGVHYVSNGQQIDAVYFDNHIHNLIVSPAPTYIPVNLNQAQLTGQEVRYAGNFGSNHLKANLTFQNPHDATTGLMLPRRAKQFGNFAASHDVSDWNVGAEVRYSSLRQDTYNNSAVTLPSYTLLNLTTRYTIDKHFNLVGRLDNLTNRVYSEVYGYNTLGRTLFVELNYQE